MRCTPRCCCARSTRTSRRPSAPSSSGARWSPDCRLQLSLGHPGGQLRDDDRHSGPAGHWVMGMNWYHRLERRYIEYGSSFEATRTFGLFRAMYDLVYNMNLDHLSWEAQTVFERLGDAGIRTAATPFLIYRGRRRHQLGLEGLVAPGRRGRQLPPRRLGPRRVLLRRPLRQPPDRLRTVASPGPGPATSTRPASPSRWSRRAPTTSCSSACPTTTSTPTGTAPRPPSTRSPRRTRCSPGSSRRAAASTPSSRSTRCSSPPTTLRPRWSTRCRSPTSWRRTGPCCSRTPIAPRRPRSRSAPPRAPAPSTSSTPGRRHAGTHERARLRLRELAGVDLVTWLAGDDGAPVLRTGVGLDDPDRGRGRGRARRLRVPLPARRPAPGRARQPLVGERGAGGARGGHHPRPLRVATSIRTRSRGSGRRWSRRTPATS